MDRKKYVVSFDRSEKTLKVIQQFLLANSDTVRLTAMRWTELGFFKIRRRGGENDPDFARVLGGLKDDLIRKTMNNKRYDDIPQGKKTFEHYFYRLSKRMKAKMDKRGIIWNTFDPYSMNKLYGFEDPTFYKKERMVGSVISHENTVTLFLTDIEKKMLEKKGVL